MRSKFAIPAILVVSFALSGTFAYAQTNPGGGSRASGYSPAEKSAGPSDPLIEKPTSGQIARSRSTRGVTTGLSTRSRSGPKAPATGAPTSSQQSPGTNGG
jgi:hypothetical protein